MKDFSAHCLMVRPPATTCDHFSDEKTALEYFPVLHYRRRLFQAYIVDEAVRIEDDRLEYIYHNQDKLRTDLY